MRDSSPLLGESRLTISSQVRDLQRSLDRALSEERWADAGELARAELLSIQDEEVLLGRRLHKGHALYNLGVVLFGSEPPSARTYIAAAHVEDVRTWPRRLPAHTVAARVLEDLFRFPRRLVAALGKLGRVTDDDPVELAEWFEAENVLPPIIEVPVAGSRPTDDLNRIPVARRVFLGGNYSRCFDRIYNAREVVIEAVLVDAGLPRQRFHDLRHACASLLLAQGVARGWSWRRSATARSA